MRVMHFSVVGILLFLSCAIETAQAQHVSPLETVLGISGRQKPAAPLFAPRDLQDHVVDGKLVLSVDDSIRLALANNTDIHLDHYQVETAEDNLRRMYAPFDPLLTSSFGDQRAKSPTSTQLLERLQPGSSNRSRSFWTGI